MIKTIFSLLAVAMSFMGHLVGDQVKVRGPVIGLFSKTDQILDGIKWGNWGSRPYEYKWVSTVVQVRGKRVIDLGVGLPSQYNWFSYVVNVLQPSFYAGIDHDARIINEQIKKPNYEIRYMSMADLTYEDNEFDVAYCISTFEHIPYDVFIKCIREAYRVLKNDGVLIVTLDERWDKNLAYTHHNGWNDLEMSLVQMGIFNNTARSSFGLSDFLTLISDYFVPYSSNALSTTYYQKANRDPFLLNSGDLYNSCVSYVVLKKKAKI